MIRADGLQELEVVRRRRRNHRQARQLRVLDGVDARCRAPAVDEDGERRLCWVVGQWQLESLV
jgi:hypothetical protein